jgi:cell division protein FtsI (penicillin-binding protein 3)|tara:strand:- start:710 stop:2494 length:1785 start_codon:yes stop_codon:yes gene_type:complete
MTRRPLRPISQIISARKNGQNPDHIERENIRQRHLVMEKVTRIRSESRLLVLIGFFFVSFLAIGLKMGMLSMITPAEPISSTQILQTLTKRADILDRNGSILATNLITNALYAKPNLMIDKQMAAKELVKIFPDLKLLNLINQFEGTKKFIWIKRKISPEQMQAVHELGEPGLKFGPREMRLYPNGRLAAHVLGGVRYGRQSVRSAELVGSAGVELQFDKFLQDELGSGDPLILSLDLGVQSAIGHVLQGGMQLMNAKGAAAILMDIHSGEIISMVSLPDFDPNDRVQKASKKNGSQSSLFNKAVQGRYELGSVFKVFTAAMALEDGIVNQNTLVDTSSPIIWGKHRISNYHRLPEELSFTDVIVKSSNTGTSRLAKELGGVRQKEFLTNLGFFESTGIELVEGKQITSQYPSNWSEISTMTISYGHGISSSPLHLAAAFASVLNGGLKVNPTLLKRNGTDKIRKRVIRSDVSQTLINILYQVVERGTASAARVHGYSVAGKTGTAKKVKPTGGYYDKKNITTFASVFPAEAPKYVLLVTLDEPVVLTGLKSRRTAGWTAAPISSEIIYRAAPLLGVRPNLQNKINDGLLLVGN